MSLKKMDHREQRERMVNKQLARRGIDDPKVLEAFLSVKRHVFVSPGEISEAYRDFPLPIGYGQTISQPYMVALMTQTLGLTGIEKVLEIGTGSGYQAAILAEICNEVYTVERDERLLCRAEKVLSEEGYNNIKFKCSDGTKGWPEEAQYDAILVTAASPDVPASLKSQLSDGGCLVIPTGERFSQRLERISRKGNDFISEDICGCIFVPLVGEEGWEE